MRVTRLAPEFIKAPVRSYLRRSAIRNALMMLSAGVTDERVHGFHKAWGSGGFSADADYMLRLANLLDKTKGPVLECGTGGTTLLANEIGLLRGFNTYSLEQEREWVKTVDNMMAVDVRPRFYMHRWKSSGTIVSTIPAGSISQSTSPYDL